MTDRPTGLRALLWRVKSHAPERWPGRARAVWLRLRLRAAATWHRATLDLDLAPDLLVGRAVRIEIAPGTANTLRWGRRGVLGAGSVIRLTGGTVDIGDDVAVRDRCVLNVGGRLRLAGRNVVSWATVLHCAKSVEIGDRTIVGEFTTIADTSHRFTGADDWILHHVEAGPVVIGANTWICSKATIARDVTIGDHCIVAANSVVTRDVPDAHLVSGVPAGDPVALRHPWLR